MHNEIIKSINKFFRKKLLKNKELILLKDGLFHIDLLKEIFPINNFHKTIGPYHIFKLKHLDLLDSAYFIFNSESSSFMIFYFLKGKQSHFFVLETLTEKTEETFFFDTKLAKYNNVFEIYIDEEEIEHDYIEWFRCSILDYLFSNANRVDNFLFVQILCVIQEVLGENSEISEDFIFSMENTIDTECSLLEEEEYVDKDELKRLIFIDYFHNHDIFEVNLEAYLHFVEERIKDL